MPSVFKYSKYRDFIVSRIEQNKAVKGYQGILAQKAGCQKSFLSQVLNSHVQLTLDQAARLCQFWDLPYDETEYFLDLVGYERASSKILRSMLDQRMKNARQRKENAQKFFESESLPEEIRGAFYSSWHYSAVLASLSIPDCNAPQKIAKKLKLPPSVIEKTLRALEKMNLVKQIEDGLWVSTKAYVHLPKDSPYSKSIHLDWRMKANEAIGQANEATLARHTTLFTVSRKTALEIQDLMIKMVDDTVALIPESPEEELLCMCCDLFKVTDF